MSSFHDVARLRARESKALGEAGLRLGAVYLAGYVVECQLKHLLQITGVRFPQSGREGHNLRGLWARAGLPAPRGHAELFLTHWGTELRYTPTLPKEADADDLLKGARELAQWVTTRIRHAESRRSGRNRGARS